MPLPKLLLLQWPRKVWPLLELLPKPLLKQLPADTRLQLQLPLLKQQLQPVVKHLRRLWLLLLHKETDAELLRRLLLKLWPAPQVMVL